MKYKLFLIIVLVILTSCTEEQKKIVGEGIQNTKDTSTALLREGKQLSEDLAETALEAIENINLEEIQLIEKISMLPALDEGSVLTAENYHEFADKINMMIELLNREGGFDFSELKGTQEEYEKISKFINEYGPLIKNYNEVIYAAKRYNKENSHTAKKFYKASGKFGLELGLIVGAAYNAPFISWSRIFL